MCKIVSVFTGHDLYSFITTNRNYLFIHFLGVYQPVVTLIFGVIVSVVSLGTMFFSAHCQCCVWSHVFSCPIVSVVSLVTMCFLCHIVSVVSLGTLSLLSLCY